MFICVWWGYRGVVVGILVPARKRSSFVLRVLRETSRRDNQHSGILLFCFLWWLQLHFWYVFFWLLLRHGVSGSKSLWSLVVFK